MAKARRKSSRRKTSRKSSSRKKSSRKKSAQKASRKKSSRKKSARKSSRKKTKRRTSSKRRRPKTTRVKVVSSSRRRKSSNQNRNILGLVLNFFFPGVGTLVSGKTKSGTWQFVLWLVGVVTSIFVIGIPLIIIAWVWAMVDSIKLVARV